MKRPLPFFKGISGITMLFAFLTFVLTASAQTAQFSPAHTYKFMPGYAPQTHGNNLSQRRAPATQSCDSNLALDYSTYNEIASTAAGITYNGSWNTATPAPYAQQLSSLLNRVEADSFQAFDYAGVSFDTLAFGNYTNQTNTSVALATSTIYLDSIVFYGGLSGDSTKMTTDSLVFTIFAQTGVNVTVAKRIVYTGMSQLRQFYLLPDYLRQFVIPVQYQFTQGQSFGVDVQWINHDTSGHFILAYSYPDSCNTIVYNGVTYTSPAHISSFPATSFWGAQVDTLTNSVTVDPQNSAYAYNLPGIPQNCLFVYQQNWEIIPIINVCQAVVASAPAVITNAATAITSVSATLNGSVNANNLSSTTGFQWGLSTAYTGGTVAAVPSPVTGSTATPVTYALSGLTPGTTYHFRALGTNTSGTTYGSDLTFTTLAASVQSCDTLFNEIAATDTPTYYTFDPTQGATGYVSGNNSYGDLAKAESFTAVAGDHVSSAYLDFAYANYIPADANVPVKIMVWDNSGTGGAPGNALDSATVTLSQIKAAITANSAVSVSFTHNVALTTSGFYVGVVLPTTNGDTVVLVTNTFYGADGHGWELDAGTPPTWASYNTDYGTTGNFGNYIEAIICPAQTSNVCTPAVGAPAGVSPKASLVPCVNQGVSYSETYTIVVPTTVVYAGQTLTITSITIDSIGNLPSGLTFMGSSNPATYNGGTTGCYLITGTTNAACGSYLTPIYLTAVTNLGTFNITGATAGFLNQFLQVITSPNGCPVLDTTQSTPFVADPACGAVVAPSVTITPTAVACFGGSTGSAVANATGGNGTYTYHWSNGATTSSISGVVSGTYSVTVTSNSQTATASAAISQPASALNVIAIATQTSCSSNTGTVTTAVTGGTITYNYHWSNGASTANLTGLGANTYTVTVTDAHSCSASASAVVSLPVGFTVSVIETNVNCYGQNTGSATAITNGSSGNLTYNWSNGATTQIISNAGAGTLNVTVTETNGCSSTGTGTITQPASALSASASSTVTSCASNTGSATVTASGGTAGYTYLWSPGAGSTTTISNLGVGVYNVTVTDTKSCTASATTSVNTSATYSVNVIPTNVGCFGQTTGGATVSVTGATGNITYDWSTSATTQSVTGLGAGTYNVTVKDGSGCAKTGSATITQPSAALSVSVTETQTACSSNTGTATATVSGGTASYHYSWSNSTTSNPATGLGAGVVILTVTDANSCSVTASAAITQPSPPAVTAVATNVTCFGQSTGTVVATVTGSTNDTYFWSNGGTSSSITNVAASQYSVTVTDAFGCSASASASVTQPNSGVTATTSSTPQSSCLTDNGTATVTASNGATPYSYLWSNSGGSATISNLAAGNYSVTVTDNNHCTASATASVNSPATFSIAVTTTNDLCYGASTGSATVTVTGSGNYTYLWSNSVTTATNPGLPAGTYGVTVTDGNSCSKASSGIVTQPATALVANATATNSTCGTASGTASVTVVGGTGSPTYLWSNNDVTSSISNLGVGVYSVTVTEGTCTATSSAIVNNLNGPSVSMLSTNPRCSYSNDGSATAVASGGTSPYTYTWSTSQTTSSISSLGAGTYNIIVADQTGCQVAGSITLTAPAVIALNPTVVNESCAGDQNASITLAVSGGTSGYTYLWSNASNNSSVTGLSAVGISVTVTDSKQCSASSSFTITQPNALTVTTSTTDATNGANGTATASVTGGTQPYTYSWPGAVNTSTSTGLAAGSYTVTVTDANHCSATAAAVVITTGINVVENNITYIKLIPNPASDLVNVVVSLSTAETVEFRLVDITGKYVYAGHESTVQGSVTHTINVAEYASGIYLVEITAGNQVIRKKLVITK